MKYEEFIKNVYDKDRPEEPNCTIYEARMLENLLYYAEKNLYKSYEAGYNEAVDTLLEYFMKTTGTIGNVEDAEILDSEMTFKEAKKYSEKLLINQEIALEIPTIQELIYVLRNNQKLFKLEELEEWKNTIYWTCCDCENPKYVYGVNGFGELVKVKKSEKHKVLLVRL
jgi:hypothetical protein